jgi:DNA-binding NarL/FixJ family response regulator
VLSPSITRYSVNLWLDRLHLKHSICQKDKDKDYGGYVPVRSVLVVDDNPTVRKIICELFTRDGDFEVCGQAENGQDAVEKAKMLQPALIVTDLAMPLMNGLEETRLLKKLMPAVPVIIYSAHIDAFIERECRAAGASTVLSKAGNVMVLIEKARHLLHEIAA